MRVEASESGIDPRPVDWSGVLAARYRIDQTLRYEYDSPIRDLHHRLMIAPRERHLDQQRFAHRIWSSTHVPLAFSTDDFGNDVASLSIAAIEREVVFGLESTIVRTNSAMHVSDVQYRHWFDVGRLTRADRALLDVAADLRAIHPNDRDCAQAIVRFVNRHMIYTKNVTDVFTTASTAYHMGRGVCQDFSHIAIALARACGIGARYASGHLIGEGATHAWVEFLIPAASGSTVLSLDPTYCAPTDFRYLVVAVGRDYGDVPPTSGTFNGTSCGTLFGDQRVRLVQLTYAA